MAKFIFVTGGVVSGLGKGITAASLGRLLKARGYKVALQKFDPYFNVDSSNLSPFQHGEVYVTEDGAEVDLVLGHYERLIDENLGINNSVTSGQVYASVIAKERAGHYNGGTVQVVPHITDEIKARIMVLSEDVDIVITEIGGTVGDIESHPFLEAIRQFQNIAGKGNVAYIHVTLVPYIEMSGEQKTKPTQHSVKELQNVGIQPDIIVCRSDYEIDLDSKRKLSLFCNVGSDSIIQNLSTENLFEIPLSLEKEGLASVVLKKLRLTDCAPDLKQWENYCIKFAEIKKSKKVTKIGIVGKYIDMHDAYISLVEALSHSGVETNTNIEIKWISSEHISEQVCDELSNLDGIIIPSGFGERGFEGKVNTAKFARLRNIPCLMIGMGAQAAVVEFARNVCGLADANSYEFDKKTTNPVVTKMGTGVFRKGAFDCVIKKGSKLHSVYDADIISERHRHKFEFNPKFRECLESKGFNFSGNSKTLDFPEAFELSKNKFFIGVIFRPEYKSRPNRPSALITAFIKACK